MSIDSCNAGWPASFIVSHMEKKDCALTAGFLATQRTALDSHFLSDPLFLSPFSLHPLPFLSLSLSLSTLFPTIFFSHIPIARPSVHSFSPAGFQTVFHTRLDSEVPFFCLSPFPFHLSPHISVDTDIST